jgi:hypothetical protein
MNSRLRDDRRHISGVRVLARPEHDFNTVHVFLALENRRRGLIGMDVITPRRTTIEL